MATHVVNNAAERERERSGTGWIVAIIALLALVLLFLFAGVFFNADNTVVPTTPGTDTGAPAGDTGVNLDVQGPAGAQGTGGAESVPVQ